MQKHLEKLPPVPFDQQITRSCDWVSESLCYDERILCLCQEIPAKLQDGPQCGLVSLWMAGQFLQPENEVTIEDIVEEATQCNYTKHGEMFSAKNMVKLAKSVFPTSQAKKMKESSTILNSLENLLTLLCIDQNLIMVPYDSDADQWPCNRKGERAHWGLIIGVAIILPYKNLAFDEAKPLDGFVSHLKPPITNETKEAILKNKEKIRYLLVTRQSKSKRLFLYSPKKMVESNTNLVGYADRHKHYELFKKEGFVMPKGGIKAGLKGQLVILEKEKIQTDHDCNSSEDNEDDESIILH